MPSFEPMREGYRNLWRAAFVKRADQVRNVALAIIEDRARYQAVEVATGVPWFWIACVHHRESNRDFRGVLHNGQRIIGTGKRTTIVPKGRGPFDSWEQAAIDAIRYMKLDRVKEWSLERMLYEFERYNGWGYNGRINSPYVWAATSNQQRGKYVADGKFDKNHWDQQLGCAAILKMLVEVDQHIAARIDAPTSQPDDPGVQPPAKPTDKPKRTPRVDPDLRPFFLLVGAAVASAVAWVLNKLGIIDISNLIGG